MAMRYPQTPANLIQPSRLSLNLDRVMTKPMHPNRTSRDRLVNLATELAADPRATARNANEPIPVFTWPRTKNPDNDIDAGIDIVEVDMPEPGDRDQSPIDPTSGDPPDFFNDRSAGQLVERWLPGGHRAINGARALMRRHRGAVLAMVAIALVAAVVAGVAMASARPQTETAPALPAAVSAMANSSSVPPSSASTHIVVSVVGKVTNPGLVTLADGARVEDAVQAAGGVLPGTDVTALNLARKLADGEQIYVGIPVPPGAAVPPLDPAAPSDAAAPDDTTKKSKKGKGAAQPAPGQKIDLNTASANDLEELPGVGEATAQRIITWRSQHGSFNSIDQLHDVGGIGAAKFAKLKDLVTV
jgi:competence protein ComEA